MKRYLYYYALYNRPGGVFVKNNFVSDIKERSK